MLSARQPGKFMGSYHNYTTHIAESYWGRRSFLHQWWGIYAEDRRWTPPLYSWWYEVLVRNSGPHLARCQMYLIHLEAAIKRSVTNIGYGGSLSLAFDERCVAACVLLIDPRRSDGTAHLALIHCVNDQEALERLVAMAWERAAEHGVVRLIGPTGLAPRWGAGLLLDHFNRAPPLHTPYNPPYAPEIFGSVLSFHSTARLYELSVANGIAAVAKAAAHLDPPCHIVPLQPERLKADLLPLVQTICEEDEFPTPDDLEIDFILRCWHLPFLCGWLALIGDQPVGFVLFQADRSRDLRRAGSGRSLVRRWWLLARRKSAVTAGRVLLGGVAPQWRVRGVGRALLCQMLASANDWGWRTLTFGPLSTDSSAAAFLEAAQATPMQTYALYSNEAEDGAGSDQSWAFF